MRGKVYFDHSNFEWVGEHEIRDEEGEVHRETEWFATKAEAEHFARTGKKEA